MSGHLFVTRGDVTALACSAWLLPGNEDRGPGTRFSWLTSTSGLRPQFEDSRLRDADPVRGCERIWRLARPADELAPQAYLMNSGGHRGLELAWYLEGLDQFLEALRQDVDRWRVGVERDRPLIAVPMFGTGEGGADQTRGGIVKQALERLADAAEADDLGADFALVTYRAADFAAAQWARKHLAGERSLWSGLGAGGLESTAAKLALKARAGQLVLFIGAGVSHGAGLPLWGSLIRQLAERAGISPAEQDEIVNRLPVVDQARIVEAKLEDMRHESIGGAVAEIMRAPRTSLAHTLLASLPVREVATTNYDDLFELASEGAGRPAAQLPYSPDAAKDRWVLKMHGTVNQPQDIVLTRDDYLSYHEQRAALAGIVQGLLITKHMLFVGFSFSDDNFHRIVHDVRNAIRPPGSNKAAQQFGTAVLIDDEFATTGVSSASEDSSLAAARRLEIFLDRLLADATTTSKHLLDQTYDELLSVDERKLRGDLINFLEIARPHHSSAPAAWEEVANLARSLGASDDLLETPDHLNSSE
jgi:hypothetical protein